MPRVFQPKYACHFVQPTPHDWRAIDVALQCTPHQDLDERKALQRFLHISLQNQSQIVRMLGLEDR